MGTEEKMTLSLKDTERYQRKRLLKFTELVTSQPLIILTEFVCKEGTDQPREDDCQWNDYYVVEPAFLIVRKYVSSAPISLISRVYF